MIGVWLALLTPEQEDRVLTTPTMPWERGGPCLLETAGGVRAFEGKVLSLRSYGTMVASLGWEVDGKNYGLRYDQLCRRLGVARANELVRTRILWNRLRRDLAGDRPGTLAGTFSAMPT